jgi:hypothetical protein
MIAAGAVLLFSGCGGTGYITGTVSLDGTPLPGGLVTVYDSEQQNFSGMIQRDGTYTVANIPLGPAQVVVQTVPALPSVINPKNPPREPFGPYVPIPERYKDKNKSGFSFEIKKGRQDVDLALVGDGKK